MYTVPANEALVIQAADTTYWYCSGGGPISDLNRARLYWNPVTGGGYRLLMHHLVSGREGGQDTFWVDPGVGGHYYVTTTDFANNESCASNEVFLPGSVTSVPVEAQEEELVETLYFNVRGQMSREAPRANGHYWMERRFRSGRSQRVEFLLLGGRMVYLK